MAKLKQSKEILRLGELLVKELDLDQSVDTLGRWMSHHISDLMAEVENSIGPEQNVAEDRCREAILALWQHINVFQRSHRPLEDTDTLFATIRALDPDNTVYFYFTEARKKIENSDLSEESKTWLELTRGIDYSARLLIGMCLSKAVADIKNDNEEWLELAKSLDAEIPQTQVIRLLCKESSSSNNEPEAGRIKQEVDILTNRKDRLKALVNLSQHLSSEIDERLLELQK